ncbi:unnamed protein product [Didymodactylos carnosus]|uniref:Uncharacterized protein n=1 Tax=Didymodactylos carnosus TaxID=1234261 RepID=A0A8S2D370_9BILA|nr:unnamed protein product [Didymodactylos carnosus]CAF3585291.1 unnamed protein product [Didymodactylos carnosus]
MYSCGKLAPEYIMIRIRFHVPWFPSEYETFWDIIDVKKYHTINDVRKYFHERQMQISTLYDLKLPKRTKKLHYIKLLMNECVLSPFISSNVLRDEDEIYVQLESNAENQWLLCQPVALRKKSMINNGNHVAHAIPEQQKNIDNPSSANVPSILESRHEEVSASAMNEKMEIVYTDSIDTDVIHPLTNAEKQEHALHDILRNIAENSGDDETYPTHQKQPYRSKNFNYDDVRIYFGRKKGRAMPPKPPIISAKSRVYEVLKLKLIPSHFLIIGQFIYPSTIADTTNKTGQ